MDELGYGLAWRILDAQFFGVAQRRRRVFLVGHIGDMRACEVLFEPESLRWDTPSSKQKREALAAAAGRGIARTGEGGVTAFAQNTRDEVRIQGDGTISGALAAQPGMKQQTYVAAIDYKQTPKFNEDVCHTLTHEGEGGIHSAVAYNGCLTPWDVQSKRVFAESGVAPTLPSGTGEGINIQPIVMASGQANAEVCEGGGHAHVDAPSRSAAAGNGCCYGHRPRGLQPGRERAVPPPHRANGRNGRSGGEGTARSRVLASNGDDVIGALCARDCKGVGSQYVNDGKVIVCESQ